MAKLIIDHEHIVKDTQGSIIESLSADLKIIDYGSIMITIKFMIDDHPSKLLNSVTIMKATMQAISVIRGMDVTLEYYSLADGFVNTNILVDSDAFCNIVGEPNMHAIFDIPKSKTILISNIKKTNYDTITLKVVIDGVHKKYTIPQSMLPKLMPNGKTWDDIRKKFVLYESQVSAIERLKF